MPINFIDYDGYIIMIDDWMAWEYFKVSVWLNLFKKFLSVLLL